ncbi:hypothetical protein EMIT0215P_60220 [Pseudomonas serboccidentalis]
MHVNEKGPISTRLIGPFHLKIKRSQPAAAPTEECISTCRSCRRLRSFDFSSAHKKAPESFDSGALLFGSTTWTRTRDPMINSHLLYQLSYCGIGAYVTDSKREVKHRL